MSTRNTIQIGFDQHFKKQGFTKKSGSWYRRSNETITAVELQKSQYGPKYYLNLGIWFLVLGDNDFPKEWKCHARTRLELLLPNNESERLTALLDFDIDMSDETRRQGLAEILDGRIHQLIDSCASIDTLRSKFGKELLAKLVILSTANSLLDSVAVIDDGCGSSDTRSQGSG